MTRVWVSGGGGFVGHHFFEHVLSATDWDVVATDSFRHKGKTDRIAQVLDGSHAHSGYERTSVITHDLTAPFTAEMTRRLGKIDYMVCFASESHVDRSITDPVPFIRNNTEVALNTLELARKLKPKAVVWISTDEVYGPVERADLKGHPEWAPILPSNPYAASKAAQEAIAISYWRTYGLPLILVNCFDMQTRVMTPDGPKRHDQLRLGDRVWAMDGEGRLVAERVTQLFRRPGPGKMVRVNAKGANYLVTHDHRMMIRRPVGSPRRWQPVEETTAGELLNLKGRVRIPRTAEWEGGSSPVVYPYDHFTPSGAHANRRKLPEEMPTAQVAALFGWYVSEGTTDGHGTVRLHGDKPGQLDSMESALDGLGNVRRLLRDKPVVSAVETGHADLADWLRTAGRLQPDRRVPQLIKGMASEYLRVFFEAACAGDGTEYGNGGAYCTSSEALAWDMAEVAMKLGFSARVSTRETWNPAKTLKKLSWIMRYSPCAGEVEARNVTEEAYEGDVWCLSVESGRVFTEREGVVSLAGQCMNMIGERQDVEKFVPMVVSKVLKGQEVTIHGRKGDIGTRHYLHSRNLADAILFLLRKQPPALFPAHISGYEFHRTRSGGRPDRYNIATPDRIDNLTLAQMIARAVGKPLHFKLEDFHSQRPGHDAHYGLDPGKLHELGWRMPIPFAESLEKTVRWSLAHPEWLLPD